jgi:hypothetical protein
MKRLIVGLACIFCVGCAETTQALNAIGDKGAVSDPANLITAATTVWEFYGRVDTQPQIKLVTGVDLTCTDPSSQNPGFAVVLSTGIGCREGYTIIPIEVSIAYTGQSWSRSALAHELEHVKLIRSGKGSPIGDPSHVTAGFHLGGEVDQANAKLAALGM